MEEAKLLFNKPKKERNEDDEEEVVEEDEENPDPMRHLEADLYP